jgi:uncharacterized protein YdeI (YjbR/CyaY-like superfamily)
MTSALDRLEQVHPEDRAAWRAWLVEHHASAPGAWLVSWKAATGRPRIPYADAVEEALCVGWVDSKAGKLDDERRLLWMSPRKPRSGWARTNKTRVARLEAEGLMAPAGRRVVEAARADGSWSLLDDVENLVVPDDLASAFDGHPGSREQFDAFPPSARRNILQWIVLARRPETRARRIAEAAELAARGERANEWKPKS